MAQRGLPTAAPAGALLLLALAAGGSPAGGAEPRRFPHVLLVTVDTLRADRLSGYGYGRPTTPRLDRLLQQGARFAAARTVEPLTSPALTSLLTALEPHQHGATRNGLPMRRGLASFPKTLARRGYRTAAFLGNWTLKDRLSGLGEHFQRYEVIVSRKRWFGVFAGEATAHDLTGGALAWLEGQLAAEPHRPVLLWVHYVEPHAPYRLQEAYAARLGIAGGQPSRADRYDTEIAFVDAEIGRLLDGVEALAGGASTLTVFAADHGESLGEHGDWGHGRHLYEPAVRIPMGIAWPGRIAPRTVEAPALNLDVAPTVLGLLGLPVPAGLRGYDWSGGLRGTAALPDERTSCHQAHKGAVQSVQDAERARERGLLEVALVDAAGGKELWRLKSGERGRFDLRRDPGESRNLEPAGAPPSPALQACLAEVRAGLIASDALPSGSTDEETLEALRALGYIE